jgi:hypothetical protein
MKVYTIVFSMIAILVILFTLTPILRRKENNNSNNERKYFSLLKKYQDQNSQEDYKELCNMVTELFKITDESEVKNKIDRDLKMMRL